MQTPVGLCTCGVVNEEAPNYHLLTRSRGFGASTFFETCPYPCNNKTCRTYIYHKTSLFCSSPPHFCHLPLYQKSKVFPFFARLFGRRIQRPPSPWQATDTDIQGNAIEANSALCLCQKGGGVAERIAGQQKTPSEGSCTKKNRNTVSMGKTHVIYSIYCLYL